MTLIVLSNFANSGTQQKTLHQSEEIVEKDKEEDFYESDVDFDEIEDDSLTDMEN